MPGCGMSPSPAISFDVSTTTTRFFRSSGQHPRDLAQEGRLPDAGPAQEQDALPGLHDVADDLHGPVHRPADPQRQADDLAGAIPQRADPVERALDAGAVIAAELPDP